MANDAFGPGAITGSTILQLRRRRRIGRKGRCLLSPFLEGEPIARIGLALQQAFDLLVADEGREALEPAGVSQVLGHGLRHCRSMRALVIPIHASA